MKKVKINNKKKKKEKKRIHITWRLILSWILILGIAIVGMIIAFILFIVLTSPDFKETELYTKEPTILYDKNGNEITRLGSEDSNVITYDELPEVLVDALVATEDSRFFEHNGIDLFRFLKATIGQLIGSKNAGGASTLSMQVVKNTYTQKGALETNKFQSLIRKFKDIYMAVFKLEANYTKEEIIEFYLNSQWFANPGNINYSGLLGVERASQYYFGKSVKDINLAEASILAGLFQSPIKNNPFSYPEECRKRQKTVLTLLVRHGYITEEQKNAVLEIPIESLLVEKTNGKLEVQEYQAFVDYVVRDVEENLGLNAKDSSLIIYTTYDPNTQKYLEDVEKGNVYEFPDDVVQEGIAVTDVKDGSILALSGGRNYQAMALNRATDINKQPGSTAKPLVDYAMYIENIVQSTYQMLLDEPTTYTNGASIGNYDGKYRGLITMRYALEDSRNIPALKVFQAVSKLDKNIIEDFVHSIGINYGNDLYESAAIGGFNGVSPLELSAAFATFGRGGYYIKPYSYTKIIDTVTGKEYNNSYTKKQVMEESTAYLMNNILMGVYTGPSVSGTNIAGKTGTPNLDSKTLGTYGLPSSAGMEVWYAIYSPDKSIALWYGYDKIYKDAKENKYYLTMTSGGNARRSIGNYIAKNVIKKNEKFKVPKTVTTANIELETFPAQLCSTYTPEAKCKTEYFVKGTEPTDISKRYSTLDNPTNGTSSFDGETINLKWDAINTPDAINETKLLEHFKENYEKYYEKYYNQRLEYNNTNIGTLGYKVYLKDISGSLTEIGYTTSNTFSYKVAESGNYTFVIKSEYSIFKDNASSGLLIQANANIETPIITIIE